jgi:hypothetical protein
MLKNTAVKKAATSFLVMAGIVASGFCQTVNISGKVTTTGGQPVQAAVVKIFSTPLACTTKADGTYLLSGTTRTIGTGPAQMIPNSITYQNHAFTFTVSAPIAASAKLYNLAGRTVAEVFSGRLNPGVTRVPFSFDGIGRTMVLLRTRIGDASETHMLNPAAGASFAIRSPPHDKAGLSKTMALDWLQASKAGYATDVQPISAYSGVVNCTLSTLSATAPNFGPNVNIFDPTMQMATIQSKITSLYGSTGQFSSQRTAYLFKPGSYSLDVTINYYIQAYGLGMSPEDVQITGLVEAVEGGTQSFWRGAENMTVTPTGGKMPGYDIWAVSQADPFRRMHVKGKLQLEFGGASGGFLSDCKIDAMIYPGSNQQFYFRNCDFTGWSASYMWNMVFQGVANPPPETYPSGAETVIATTPLIREKPFLTIDAAGNYSVFVPALRKNSQGTTWYNTTPAGESMPIDQFYIAIAGTDNATTINTALGQGKNLLLTPGVYSVNAPIVVQRPNTVVLGIGMATLQPQNGVIALKTSDAGGITIANILFDAGTVESPALLQVGDSGSVRDNSANPPVVFDIFARIGGGGPAKATVAVILNSNNTILDHCWLWRADHGSGAGWTTNPAQHGLIVNGKHVISYGQQVEHFQQHNTVWNGDSGQTYFYQNELPYDVPNQAAFMTGTEDGIAPYYVTNGVTNFTGWGLGIYTYFNQAPVILNNAMEVPKVPGVSVHHVVTFSLGNDQGQINHAVNDTGAMVKWSTSTHMVRFGDYVGH